MRCLTALTACICLLALPATVSAQNAQGRIAGSIRDSSSAFVGAAKVTARNERTGEERSATSNPQGFFLIDLLRPSTYTIKTEKPGFATIEYSGMVLALGQELAIDFELKPAGVTEDVTVVGSTQVLDISSARLGVNVSEREVNNLPVNGRQMSQLLLQAPGSQNAGSGTWQDIRFSGRAVEQNAIRYDGIEGSAIIDAAPGNLNGEVATPFKLQASLENIQEFRVESSAYPAEYGTGSGGQVSVITKSGSNAFHGAAFEYLRRDALDAPNYFDWTRSADGAAGAFLGKSPLKQDQWGGSIGGPVAKDRAFFFGSFERYNLNAGINIVEAVPSAAAWARAVPTIAGLRPNFLAPGAVVLPGKSTNADFDIAQLQSPQVVTETAASGRFDFRISSNWSSYVRVFHDEGTSDAPDNVSGRVVHTEANPSNAVFNVQAVLSDRTTNELKFGYNGAPTRINGVVTSGGADLSAAIINLTGSVANNGIAGQGANSGITVPGGLVRSNSAQNGRAQPYDPYTLSFIDSLSSVRGNHLVKTGGEIRLIRMQTDRLGGTTYTFQNINAFLANQPSSIQFLGDLSDPSVFNNGATGPRHIEQEYYIGYAQDEWHANHALTLNFGVRYDYYSVIRERNSLQVKFNPDTGVIDPNTTPVMKSVPWNFQPRVGATLLATEKTIIRGGFGMFVGPGQTEDQVQTIADSDRVSATLTSGASLVYPLDPAAATSVFVNNPNNRSYQPRAYRNEYEIPERIWQYTGSLQRELLGRMTATVAYVGAQGRNLFLRSIANPITSVVTNPNPASAGFVIRQFSIVQRDAAGAVTGVQNPYAEIDTKTSGGHDNYNALQLGLSRRSANGLAVNAQYTLSRSFGNTSGSNEALTAGNAAQTLDAYDYDTGYNAFDVRHTFNFSALYSLPFGAGRKYMNTGVSSVLLGGWDVGGIINARSGLPIDVRVTRPDILYKDAAGIYYNNPAAGRVAVINTPNGGASRNVRRPDLVAGVDPFVTNGGLVFLNPAAFATPQPGSYGNLERGLLHGPTFAQVDLVVAKRFPVNGPRNAELRVEVFNLFNQDNFVNPAATLPNAIPTTATTEANRVQPGQPFTSAAAGTFGIMNATVSRTVGLGTQRQVQLAFRFNF